MTVEETDKIDFITTKKGSDTVSLIVSDHLEWSDPEHLHALQEKINTYLAFIESGELYQTYPNAQGKKLKIDVKLKHAPDEAGTDFLNKCADTVLSAGLQFDYEVMDI